MAFPSDISLPANAKYYSIIETKKAFNSNYDITWSFQYKYSDSSSHQLGFATFLNTETTPVCSLPGQYLGDRDPVVNLSSFNVSTQAGAPITTEGGTYIITSPFTLSGPLLKVAFDSTGLYALSGRDGLDGVGIASVHNSALVVRDYDYKVRANGPLSSMNVALSTLSVSAFRTLRFRYVNLGRKLHVDLRESDTTSYTLLTTIDLDYRIADYNNLSGVYVGFALCTPISSASTTQTVTEDFLFKNFQVEGYEGNTLLTETLSSSLSGGFFEHTALSANPNTIVESISNIEVY